jgi:hypothetical protein
METVRPPAVRNKAEKTQRSRILYGSLAVTGIALCLAVSGETGSALIVVAEFSLRNRRLFRMREKKQRVHYVNRGTRRK